jgi:hypothetical protein
VARLEALAPLGGNEPMIKNYREQIGDVIVSYAVGHGSYSSSDREEPRSLRHYASLEIAVFRNGSAHLDRPEDVGLESFAHLWEPGLSPIAVVTWEEIDAIRAHLAGLHKVQLRDPQPFEHEPSQETLN